MASGYSTQLWTTARVAEVIWKTFRVRYHRDHVGRLLHSLGWSHQKPQKKALERNQAEIRRFPFEFRTQRAIAYQNKFNIRHALMDLGGNAQKSGMILVAMIHARDHADASEAGTRDCRDVVIVVTAGRLHTQANLMEELSKVRRVIQGRLEGAPHETLLVVDATTGQNGLQQARLFGEAVGVTGVVLTKLDGSAKGGIAVAIAHELGLPVKLIGVGERLEDLRPFDPDDFARALVSG